MAASPTTRYRDYAISPKLIHWESQSTTRADSETGLRYRNHERLGRSIMLFTRLRAEDRAFWFLGPATYRGHVGEKPMAITWELQTPLPGICISRSLRRWRDARCRGPSYESVPGPVVADWRRIRRSSALLDQLSNSVGDSW